MPPSGNAALQLQFFTWRILHLKLRTDYADRFLGVYRTVPTEDEILVPETLLKKRKSQEKAREERSAELQKKKKVGPSPHPFFLAALRRLWTWTMVMIHTHIATRP